MNRDEFLVCSVPRFAGFADEFAAAAHLPRLTVTEGNFDNGEYHRLVENPRAAREKRVIVVGGTDDGDFIATMDYVEWLSAKAHQIVIFDPYFRYSTQERKDKDGRIIIALNRARQLSRLPQGNLKTRVVLVELHTEQIRSYFGDQVATDHLRYVQFTEQIIREQLMSRYPRVVVGTADSSKKDWVFANAQALDLPDVYHDARRLSPVEKVSLGILGRNAEAVDGAVIAIVDDIARSLGTGQTAAAEYKKKGAAACFLICPHADLTPNAVQNMLARPDRALDGVFIGSAFPSAQRADGDFVKVIPSEGYLAQKFVAMLGIE